MKRYVVGLTGASGIIYGITLIRELLALGVEVNVISSRVAKLVLEQEQGLKPGENAAEALASLQSLHSNLVVYENTDIAAPLASGSYITEAMIIMPCTMATLSSLAHGSASSLMERTADVMLKENRPLVVVPRETPLNKIHIRNMLILAEAGAHIVPAMPAFYHNPGDIQDLVHFMVGKVMDVLRLPHQLFARYGDPQ
ncbi:MAG: UbiX family flavin prenyltransferase [Syntrophomonadaceae bacterium]|jgi:4-hydroxy-3-polyprenylbenzoate decarboxylase